MKNQLKIHNSNAKIDQVDGRIIDLLQEDARRTNVEIANKSGVSESTVKYRIDRLVEQDILHFITVLNPHVIGYPNMCAGLLRVDSSMLSKIGKKLKEINEVVYVGYLSGRFDIVFSFYLKDTMQLPEIIVKKIGNIPGIRSTETFLILDLKRSTYSWKPLLEFSHDDKDIYGVLEPKRKQKGKSRQRGFKEKNKIDEIKLDRKDIQIIKLIQEEGRRKNSSIARLIKLSESTVKNRIERLFQNRAIRVKAVLNPRAFGYHGRFHVEIRVKLSELEEVTEKLLKLNEVVYLAHLSGRFDIIIDVLLREPEQLVGFIENKLGRIPGIISTESFYLLNEETIDYDWDL